jgi:hypothetical protein
MGKNSKRLIIALTLAIVLLFTALVGSVSAQTIPKPSVPEFTVSFVDLSYDVPTTTSIDQYTGQTITHQGYYVENKTLQLTIKNQPFTSYIDNGQNNSFYFNVREKGYFTDNWIELYRPSDGYPTQTNSEYTIITLGILGDNGVSLVTNAKMIDVPAGGQIDFQVQALIGAVHRGYNASATNQLEMFPWVFDGQTSDWSNTQTLTIPESLVSATPVPTLNPTLGPTPTVPEFTATIAITFLAVTALAVAVISRRKLVQEIP